MHERARKGHNEAASLKTPPTIKAARQRVSWRLERLMKRIERRSLSIFERSFVMLKATDKMPLSQWLKGGGGHSKGGEENLERRGELFWRQRDILKIELTLWDKQKLNILRYVVSCHAVNGKFRYFLDIFFKIHKYGENMYILKEKLTYV